MIEQLLGGGQEIDRHELVAQAADQLVAVSPDGGELDEVVIERQCLNRPHGIGLAPQIEIIKRATHVVLRVARELGVGEVDRGNA